MSCFTYFCGLFTPVTEFTSVIEFKPVIKFKPVIEKEDDIIKWEDTVEFTFPITGGKVIKVYDADTITIATKLPFNDSPLYRLSVRLNGIDAPEIKGKGVSDDEKDAAILARDVVANMVLHKYVVLKNIQTEKYGRVLADVYIDDINLNDYLITNRYAVKYDGGKKIKPESWLNYINNNNNKL
jgi:micrococcal nuclease